MDYKPSFETLEMALECMSRYRMDPKAYLVSSNPTYEVLLGHAPFYSLKLYALAGHFDLYELASTVSSHLLSLPLSALSDESATRMGSKYVARLYELHLHRMAALKDIVFVPPLRHTPTNLCSLATQDAFVGKWALVVTRLATEATPGDSSLSCIKRSSFTYDPDSYID